MRKMFGVLLLLSSACLMALLCLFIPQLLNALLMFTANGGAGSFGYVLGQLIVFLIFLMLAGAFGFLGYKLIRKAKPTVVKVVADEDFPSKLKSTNKN